MKIRPVGAELFQVGMGRRASGRAGGRTDRHNELIISFRSSANALKTNTECLPQYTSATNGQAHNGQSEDGEADSMEHA